MTLESAQESPLTKGERTEIRILDTAEAHFAKYGYGATSLRSIAKEVGIQVPGLYKYFESKEALYEHVLERALQPMQTELEKALEETDSYLLQLPGILTDLYSQHPRTAALFQNALQTEEDSVGSDMINAWLDRFFKQGIDILAKSNPKLDKTDLSLYTIALYNLTSGFFLAQPILDRMMPGKSILDKDVLNRQKILLSRILTAE